MADNHRRECPKLRKVLCLVWQMRGLYNKILDTKLRDAREELLRSQRLLRNSWRLVGCVCSLEERMRR